MSYMLPHLHNGWQVDQAILSEEDRVVVIRFGHDWDPTCMKMDEVLYSIAEKVKQPHLPSRPAARFGVCILLDCCCFAEMADNGRSSSSCYELCLDTPAVLKLKILQLFILWILQKYLTSTKCMSYMIRVLSCFSSGTSTS
ncbi:thioredoxin-like protein 4A isoform X2 [Bos indicus]|uniref:Thioredoxin-like protein 4A isoform X2 n=1 Tax=Bos indicus TaxID=9915 RepID=A0ABM4RGP4_BOSIN